MQNRSLGVQFVPIDLDDAFPIEVVPDFTKSDRPIRALHVHNCTEIGYCQKGSGIMIVGDKVLNYRAGDVTFINQSEMHFSTSARGTVSEWSWIMLDPLKLVPHAPTTIMDPWAFSGRTFENVISGERRPILHAAVRQLLEEYRDQRVLWKSAVRALAWAIMIEINRYGSRGGEVAVPKTYDRLAPALQALAEDCGRRWTIGELAKSCGLSEPHFRRVWKAALGQSPQSYMISLRMQMAAALLRSSRGPIIDISMQVGFESLSSFNRLFQRHFSCTPSQWRASAGQASI